MGCEVSLFKKSFFINLSYACWKFWSDRPPHFQVF
jgi:hypothetical protein